MAIFASTLTFIALLSFNAFGFSISYGILVKDASVNPILAIVVVSLIAFSCIISGYSKFLKPLVAMTLLVQIATHLTPTDLLGVEKVINAELPSLKMMLSSVITFLILFFSIFWIYKGSYRGDSKTFVSPICIIFGFISVVLSTFLSNSTLVRAELPLVTQTSTTLNVKQRLNLSIQLSSTVKTLFLDA